MAAITDQRAWLILLDRQRDIYAALPPHDGTFLVQHDGSYFGILAFQQEQTGEDQPHLSFDQLREIANMCGWILSSLMDKAIQQVKQQGKLLPSQPLSKREREVLQLMARSDEEIAQALKIEVVMVKKYRERIRAKLGAEDDTEALLVAFRQHLYFPLEDVMSRSMSEVV